VQAENIYEISDSFSRIVGKHGLKAGGEVHSNQINTHIPTLSSTAASPSTDPRPASTLLISCLVRHQVIPLAPPVPVG
jgi:hypothetical protein